MTAQPSTGLHPQGRTGLLMEKIKGEGKRMNRLTRADLAVAGWLARMVNGIRFRLGFRAGRHRSLGLSTFEWVRMEQASRGR